MTFIDFFVSAYWSSKGKSLVNVNIILADCGRKYLLAKDEYNAMKEYYSSEEMVEWIRERISFGEEKFSLLYPEKQQ